MNGSRCACVWFVVASTGCSLSRAPTPAEVLDQALRKGTVRTAWSAGAPVQPVAGDWLRSFHDPRLDALVAEAIANNLDLRQAAAKVEIARDNVALVGAQLQPQVSLDAGADVTVDLGKRKGFPATKVLPTVSWEIDVWGKVRAQREAAKASYEATALDFAFARQSLAATTANAWYQAIELRQLVVVATESVAIYQQMLDLVEVRASAGKVADLDLAEVRATLAEARSDLEVAKGLYSQSLRNLELILGRFPAGDVEVAPELRAVPSPIGSGVPATLLERRPDILAAERQTLVAFRLTESAKLARWPQFSISADLGRLSDGILSLIGLNPWFFRGAVGMSVPIYTGGALTANIAIATAQQELALAHYGAVILQAFGEVEIALTNEVLLGNELAQEESCLVDRIEAVRIGRIKYETGAIDMLPLLQLQSYLQGTRSEVVKLRYSQLANRIELHLALGASFDQAPASSLSSSAQRSRP